MNSPKKKIELKAIRTLADWRRAYTPAKLSSDSQIISKTVLAMEEAGARLAIESMNRIKVKTKNGLTV